MQCQSNYVVLKAIILASVISSMTVALFELTLQGRM